MRVCVNKTTYMIRLCHILFRLQLRRLRVMMRVPFSHSTQNLALFESVTINYVLSRPSKYKKRSCAIMRIVYLEISDLSIK